MSGTTKQRQRRLVQRPEEPGLRQQLFDIIFEADSPAGKWFDIALLIAIACSIAIVSIESMPSLQYDPVTDEQVSDSLAPRLLGAGEWLLTVLFTVEYVLRLTCVRYPLRYAFSFWGIVDLVSIIPSYMTLLIGRTYGSFMMLRSVRLLRVFRVLKLWRMMSHADELADAVWRSREKIIVFLAVVLVAVTITGTLMYHIETVFFGDQHDSDFSSIPQAMYWAIVTMTTVGYGDVVPHTSLGKVISAVLILLGYSLIIVPTGFVSAEITNLQRRALDNDNTEEHPCPGCDLSRHAREAVFCYRCGVRLDGTPNGASKSS
ncbi:MAG: ion transporter [Planctomycetota bacterium]